MANEAIFQPLVFPHLKVKNRIFRSNMSGRFDNYDGSGNQARINWEVKFAKGGVGAILSSFVAVQIQGRIMPNYATIESEARIPFWRAVGEAVHAHDCKFILQLSHSGRQRDIGGIEYEDALSSTDKTESLHGFECKRMNTAQIKETVQAFGEGARRAREAGLDGVELHGANGYLITQFLSSAINDRKDDYGGSLRNRARFLLEIVRAIRKRAGEDFHLQVKISSTEHHDALRRREPDGNTIQDSVQVCKWLEEEGVHAIHVSAGSYFPHPKNPAGDLPVEDLIKTYDAILSSGQRTLRNYLLFRGNLTSKIFRRRWRTPEEEVEGLNLGDSRAIKKAVRIPVICTGGFQTASVIVDALKTGSCDAVSIARSLIANNDLVDYFRSGKSPPKPCTYCNKCLANVVENPLGCYDETRFRNRDEMIRQIMSVYDPPPFA